MVILITYSEEDEKSRVKTGRVLVSHGINTETLGNVTLPAVEPSKIGYFDDIMGEWILGGKPNLN